MVRCIVKSCANTTDKFYKTKVSFFYLPKNEIMREGWLRKIGEVILPSNIKYARICSDHFTKESFHVGRRQKSRKCINARRLLLPNAFPTIMLSSTKNKTVSIDFKVIHREFLLPTNIHRSTEKGPSNNEEAASTSRIFQTDGSPVLYSLHSENATPNSLSVSETVVKIETPKSHVQKESQLDKKRIFETPQHTSEAFDNVCNNTFPRSTDKGPSNNEEAASTFRIFQTDGSPVLDSLHPENATPDPLSVSETVVKIETPKSHVQKKSQLDKKRIFETPQRTSDAFDNVCNNTFPRRFIMENGNNIHITHKKRKQNEEAYNQSMKLLKAELEHFRSLNEFHLQARCNNLDEMKDLEKECQALRLQLVQKTEDIQQLIEEKKQMLVIINDLQMKLVTADLDKCKFERTMENKMIEILQRYFTEGQIRCILENRKYVRWSKADYAAAMKLRRVSPKAYSYLLKHNFPLPSRCSLKRFALKKFDEEEFLSDTEM